jgi:hypothetical protein
MHLIPYPSEYLENTGNVVQLPYARIWMEFVLLKNYISNLLGFQLEVVHIRQRTTRNIVRIWLN